MGYYLSFLTYANDIVLREILDNNGIHLFERVVNVDTVTFIPNIPTT